MQITSPGITLAVSSLICKCDGGQWFCTVNSAEKSMLRSSLIWRSGVGTRSSCCALAALRLPDRLGGMLATAMAVSAALALLHSHLAKCD